MYKLFKSGILVGELATEAEAIEALCHSSEITMIELDGQVMMMSWDFLDAVMDDEVAPLNVMDVNREAFASDSESALDFLSDNA